jgi:hypothetical protein
VFPPFQLRTRSAAALIESPFAGLAMVMRAPGAVSDVVNALNLLEPLTSNWYDPPEMKSIPQIITNAANTARLGLLNIELLS